MVDLNQFHFFRYVFIFNLAALFDFFSVCFFSIACIIDWLIDEDLVKHLEPIPLCCCIRSFDWCVTTELSNKEIDLQNLQQFLLDQYYNSIEPFSSAR